MYGKQRRRKMIWVWVMGFLWVISSCLSAALVVALKRKEGSYPAAVAAIAALFMLAVLGMGIVGGQ